MTTKTKEPGVFSRLLRYAVKYKWGMLSGLFFVLVTTVVTTGNTLLIRYYIDQHIEDGVTRIALVIMLFNFGMVIIRAVSSYLSEFLFAKVAYATVRDLRLAAFSNIQQLGMSYFDQTPAGAIVSRLTNDTQAVADMFATVFQSFLKSGFIFVATLVAMFSLSWQLTLFVLLFLPVIWGSVALYRHFSEELVTQTRQKLSEINVKLSESIEGMRIIQAFRQEGRLTDEFEAINEEHMLYANRTINVNSFFLRPAMSLLKILAYAMILTYFGLNWQTSTFSAGLIYAFIQYVSQLFDPLIEVTQNYATLQTSMISAKRVFEMIDRDDYEPHQAGQDFEITRGDVVFDKVSFSYDGKKDVLKNISFTVKQGETIAFVGSTGSGKSSIINLFMRFYEYERGQITIDGHDIKDYSQDALRRQTGLVLQDPFLYHGTIASNIQMYQDISREEVEVAARFVDAHDFISALPAGYDNPVSERGTSYSSGQRQLLAFARTMATEPKILILDEATANIDSETEEIIQGSLRKMRQGRTTIAIAHRLSTIQDANCIYVLDKGEIIESGTHEELLALGGTYHKMYQLQAGMMEKA
ncbi:ABC transporter ATP-binding protein [Streptococcus moroccensis]|uniref:ATP-binding cassette subfamily B protein n=1 Tax=Streptococcus moroccensis TaxID=1451356 RepID=A0ABT9YU79_9STRE|nr:ATP-binding cassette subfamily B protein [Streptococcus moroccensis]